MHRIKRAHLWSLLFLALLTIVLLWINGERRRAYVPAMAIQVPPSVNRGGRPLADRIVAVRFSPREHYIAFADDLNRFFVAKQGGDSIQSLGRGFWGMPDSLSWSRDGKRIYNTSGAMVQSWDLSSKKQNQFLAASFSDSSTRPNLVLSPNKTLSLVSTYIEPQSEWKTGSLWLIEVPGGKRRWGGVLQRDKEGYLPFLCGLAFSPDEKAVAVATMYYGVESDGKLIAPPRDLKGVRVFREHHLEIVLRSVTDGRVLQKLPPLPTFLQPYDNGERGVKSLPITISPNGKVLAAADVQGIFLFDLPQSKLKARLLKSPHTKAWGDTRPLVFSPDGRLLALGCADAIEVWGVASQRLLQVFYASPRSLSFSFDGKWLASDTGISNGRVTSDSVSIWEVGSLGN